MAVPSQKDIKVPLLEEIEGAGGETRPRDLYANLALRFPEITQEDLNQVLPEGHNRWANRVQWVRQELV